MAEQRYAILIASSSFPEEPGLTTLRCPENDVDAVDKVLLSPDFGQFAETFVFKNKPSHEVLEQIETVLADAGREDLVLIYFSGHGKLNNASNQLCLATANTKLRALGSTSIPIERIKSFFDAADTRKKILILDCCYSGKAGEAFTKGSVTDQLQLMSGQGTFIMTASTGFETALEKEGDSLGLFTKHLVEGIRSGEADRDEDGLVDIHELYQHVHEKVRAEGKQEPMKWDINAKGRMIIAKSGKDAKEKRRQELRTKLYALAGQGLLTDSIVSEAVKVVFISTKDMSDKDKECSLLVEQLAADRINAAVFVESWVKTCLADKQEADRDAPDSKKTLWNWLLRDVFVDLLLRVVFVVFIGAVGWMGLKRWEVKPETKQIAFSASEAKNPPAMGKISAHHLPAPSLALPVPSPLPKRAPQQGDEIEDSATGMKLVYVPDGCFKMGSPSDDPDHHDDEKLHDVCVDGFWMGKYEVTQGQWKKVMGENPSRFKKGNDYPIESVSWDDTKTFIETLNKKSGKNYRLSTEAEWEYACRANSSGKYCGGDDLDAVAWHRESISDGSTHPVGRKEANVFGLHDMSGNVWEWCADRYQSDYYTSSPKNNPQGPESGEGRVLRGGSYLYRSLTCRAVYRNSYPPGFRLGTFGFRLVLPVQVGGR